MIFSQLFSPRYKNSDPKIRIASVEKLDKNVEKEKRILHELAFNDSNESVSLAALNKLDSFVLWMKSAETSSSLRIKKHAQEVCLLQLEDSAKVPDKLFLPFVQESKNKPFLEQMLFTSKRLQQYKNESVEVLLSLHNAAHTRRFFHELASPAQQSSIIETIDDVKTLNRLAKHAKDASVTAKIDEKLALLADFAERPNKIKQRMTMINSRLLALKEAHDYEYLHSQFEQLSQEFEQLKPEFNYVDELSSAAMTEKYLGLKIDIQQKLAKLEQAHQSQLALQRTSKDLRNIQERCKQVQIQIDLISQVSNNNQNTNSDIDAEVKILTSSLINASEELEGINQHTRTQAHELDIKELKSKIVNMHKRLLQVFDIIEFSHRGSDIVRGLTLLIDSNVKEGESHQQISQQALSELKQQISAQKDAFELLKSEGKDLLSSYTINNFSKALARANKLSRGVGQQFKDQESKCENKLKTVNRMINDGKFKPAMATFFQAKRMYEGISEHAPIRLQKAFKLAELEVTKLQDWQSYIAQPRKPAVLEKAKNLAESQFVDPYERTEQVKQLRLEWKSLGQLHTPEDEVHNKAFDAHIEKAFIPCRAFFAEIERQREDNYQKALLLVTEAKSLNPEMPASELTSKISALKTKFNNLGEIDKAKVNKVRREFTKIFKPLSFVISAEQNRNAEQKQAIISQANKLNEDTTETERLPELIEQAKALQQRWKQLGFAGRTIDNQLWQEFRKVNDALFERYHKDINSRKNALQQEFGEIDNEIVSISVKVKAAKSITELQFYEQELTTVVAKMLNVDEGVNKRLQPTLRKLEDIYSARVKKLNEVRHESSLSNLFLFLNEYKSADLPEKYDTLLSRYKTWIKSEIMTVQVLEGLDRVALTQAAAILLDIAYNDVPVGDKVVRKNVQLKMMASKLQGDAALDTEIVLAHWVRLGPVQPSELESLQAMEKMFVG